MRTIGFLGTGNMGGAILRGYSADCKRRATHDAETATQIVAYRRDREALAAICAETGATACDSVEELVSTSDVLLIGIKPQTCPEVLPTVAAHFPATGILVSMAAGVTMEALAGYVGEDKKLVRIMPNTPAAVGEAVTSVSRNDNVTDEELSLLMDIFRSIGRAEEVPESLISAVTGVAGSSPAYTYMYIDALMRAAVRHGMPAKQARTFAAQAVLGAAKMVLTSEDSPEQLRINVCSPGGVTIKAVETLQENDFEQIVEKAFDAAVARADEMARE